MAKSGNASFLPTAFNLTLYAGDGATLRLTVTDADEAALPVTGEVAAQIRQNRADEEAVAAFEVDLTDGGDGVVVLRLSGVQTAALCAEHGTGREGDFSGAWDVQWSPDEAEPLTLLQGTVKCEADVTRA